MKTVHGGIMIKFIMGVMFCYILIELFGMSVFSDMYSVLLNMFSDVKEVTNQ